LKTTDFWHPYVPCDLEVCNAPTAIAQAVRPSLGPGVPTVS
jgi:hypothetical protein